MEDVLKIVYFDIYVNSQLQGLSLQLSKGIQFYLKLFKVNKNLAQLSFQVLLTNKLLDKNISKTSESISLK